MYRSANAWNSYYKELERIAQSLLNPSTGMLDSKYSRQIPCPVCRSQEYRPRFVVNGFPYVTCKKCGLVYINPQPTAETIRQVYNNDQARLLFFKEVLLPFAEHDQKQIFQKRARKLRSLITNNDPKLLDVGCAAGGFMIVAQEEGFQVEGIELNAHYVEFIKQHRSLKVHNQPLEDLQYEDNTFDTVTLWDVLEHVRGPMNTLKEIHRILKPEGVLGFTTINHHCFNEKILRHRWRYYQPPDHLCSFTPFLLHSMLHNAGYSVISIQHHYMYEVLADAFLKLNTNPRKNSFLSKMSNKINKGIFLLLTWILGFIFNSLRSGDLLTVYARKS
jgi:ubiquinone/menaquinone biosynthesis C-methylase UbiE